MIRRKVLIVGLDGAPAAQLFDQMPEFFPTFWRLARQGTFGVLWSCDPPITVPAWACMMSGKDPGELGLYGFKLREGYGYNDYGLVHARLLPRGMLWDWVAERGGSTVLLGVPPSYPPPEVRGASVSCLLTPPGASPVCYPSHVEQLLREIAPDFLFDIANFRSLNEATLMEQAAQGLRARFRFARALASRIAWNLFIITDIGTDRVQHGLWSGDHDWGGAVRDYYRMVDEELGRWLEELPDDTCVWIVSDHGAQACRGGVWLNEWLRQHGWLKLRKDPASPQPLIADVVDWEKTIAWAEGGYVGRIYMNIRGRQPAGVVHPSDVARMREEIRNALAAGLTGSAGGRVPVSVYSPSDLYRDYRGFPPDLFVYADELRYRVFGTVGVRDGSALENDPGRDRANHHRSGMFIAYDPKASARGETPLPLPLLGLRPYLEAQLLGESVCITS